MRTVHVLRKFDPAEWGGTESAVSRLLTTLDDDGVQSVVYCPRPRNGQSPAGNGNSLRSQIRYYNACVPVWGLSPSERQQFVAVGGNLVSFDLLPSLWYEPGIQLVHSHTMGRLGAIAGAVARRRRVPFVITIHGGFMDLPPALRQDFFTPSKRGFDWGRVFGLLLRSRQLLEQADAILTCNPTEATLLRQKFPRSRVETQPHGIHTAPYEADAKESALSAWPQLRNRQVLLCVGRVDPVKNQQWLIEQAGRIVGKYPEAMLVFAGPLTDPAYAAKLKATVQEKGLADRVLFTGGLAASDPRLIGLFQTAALVVLPSVSETFGLVLLEAWAAKTPVLASRTSGATALIKHGENGWLFDLAAPDSFHAALAGVLPHPATRERAAQAGQAKVLAEYDVRTVARRTRQLYHQLIEAHSCAT